MNEQERQLILTSLKSFRNRVANNHIKYQTTDIKNSILTFTLKYLSNFAFGDSTPEIWQRLYYPEYLEQVFLQLLFSSIFCSEVLTSYSTTSGIDINLSMLLMVEESIVKLKVDTTINNDNITTIINHSAIRNL